MGAAVLELFLRMNTIRSASALGTSLSSLLSMRIALLVQGPSVPTRHVLFCVSSFVAGSLQPFSLDCFLTIFWAVYSYSIIAKLLLRCPPEAQKRKEQTPLVVTTQPAQVVIKGYVGARTRHPPIAQTHERRILLWVREVVCRGIQIHPQRHKQRCNLTLHKNTYASVYAYMQQPLKTFPLFQFKQVLRSGRALLVW